MGDFGFRREEYAVKMRTGWGGGDAGFLNRIIDPWVS
jgi:hypothetical protein